MKPLHVMAASRCHDCVPQAGVPPNVLPAHICMLWSSFHRWSVPLLIASSAASRDSACGPANRAGLHPGVDPCRSVLKVSGPA